MMSALLWLMVAGITLFVRAVGARPDIAFTLVDSPEKMEAALARKGFLPVKSHPSQDVLFVNRDRGFFFFCPQDSWTCWHPVARTDASVAACARWQSDPLVTCTDLPTQIRLSMDLAPAAATYQFVANQVDDFDLYANLFHLQTDTLDLDPTWA